MTNKNQVSKFLIKGGFPLKGVVSLGGAKNASFKLMIAALLSTAGKLTLDNISELGDVLNTIKTIKDIGGKVEKIGEKRFVIDPSAINSYKIPKELALKNRAPIMFVGPLLARFKRVVLPYPGGDWLGARPLDRHFKALEQLGVRIRTYDHYFEAVCDQLKGAKITFLKNTHTGTEVLMMTAVLAQGRTIINNAASEPEVDELINLLNNMGAKVKRIKERKIVIDGVKHLKAASYRVMPDRNEAVTFALVALGTKGDIFVKEAQKKQLEAFLGKLETIGAGFKVEKGGIRFFYKNELRATTVRTAPHPGFMTDWQPLWTTLMTQAKGESRVVETIFPRRFAFVKDLKRMGANIKFFNPKVSNPESFYNFDLKNDDKNYQHGVIIKGPTKLKGIKTRVGDLRAGATLVLAALMATGESELEYIEEIDRGYEKLDKKLIKLGANIKRK